MKDLWSLFQAWSYSRLVHSRLGCSWLGHILRDVVPGLVVPGLVVLGLVVPVSVGVPNNHVWKHHSRQHEQEGVGSHQQDATSPESSWSE
jgi:hypothetical protein